MSSRALEWIDTIGVRLRCMVIIHILITVIIRIPTAVASSKSIAISVISIEPMSSLAPSKISPLSATFAMKTCIITSISPRQTGTGLPRSWACAMASVLFSVQGSYAFQDFDNTGYKKVNREDAGYQGNIYRGVLRMKAMPLKGESTKKQSWAPYLELIKEDRYYQGDNAYYGSRVYKVFTTKAGMDFKLKPGLNLSLDYHHIK